MAGFASRICAGRDVRHCLRDLLGCDAIRSGADDIDLSGMLHRKLGSLSCRENSRKGGCRHPCEMDVHQGFVSGDLRIEGRSVESCSNFSSFRASTSVAHQGKWMFEVTLGTSGIMQLGWATFSCQFSNEEGVGDSMDSYSFDGKRVRKWNISCLPYGQEWAQGDVIGCAIDLDAATISFSRNGADLGIAFQNIRRLAYFPAASLSYGERCEFNFGGRPFAHPIRDHQPMVEPPAQCAGAAYLLGCFRTLTASQLEYNRSCRRGAWAVLSEAGVLKQLLVDLGGLLGPMLETEYVVMDVFLPFLLSLVEEPAMAAGGALFLAISLLKAHIASSEMRAGFLHVLDSLSWKCRTASCASAPGGAGKGAGTLQAWLDLVTHLLHVPCVRDTWLAAPGWLPAFEGFLAVKAPTARDLGGCVPFVHWPDADKLGMDVVSRDHYKRASRDLQAALAAVHDRHSELCSILLTTPGSRTWGREDVPNRLTELVQYLVRKNRGASRNMPPPGLSDNSVLVSAFFTLLRILRPYLEGRSPGLSTFPAGLMFLQGVGSRHLDPYSGAGRLGGALSHLEKTAKPDAATLNTTVSVAPVEPQPEAPSSAGAASQPGPPTPAQLTPRQRGALLPCPSASSASSSSNGTLSSRDSSEGCECSPMETCAQQATRKRLHVNSFDLPAAHGGGGGGGGGGVPSPSSQSWSAVAALPTATREPLQHAWSAPSALSALSVLASSSQGTPEPPHHHARFAAAEPLGSPSGHGQRQGLLPPWALFQGPTLGSWVDHTGAPRQAAHTGASFMGFGGGSRSALHALELMQAQPRSFDQTPHFGGFAASSHRCPHLAAAGLHATAAAPMQVDGVPGPCSSFTAGTPLQASPERWPSASCPSAPPTPAARLHAPAGTCGRPPFCGQPGAGGSGQSRREVELTGREAACLLDALLRLYHLGMVSAFRAASFQQQTATQAQQHVEELKHQLQSMENSDEELLKWAKSMKSWQRVLVDSARFAAWHNACLFGARDMEGLMVLGTYCARLLSALSEHRVLFQYVPELYLEALLDGFHAVRSRPHTSKSPLFAAAADALVPFLARRFRDSAIVGPDLREMMLQTVSLLLQTKAFVAKFEESHDARAHLVEGLLEAFSVRDWVPVSSILSRLTSSTAFGASLARATTSSSAIFQASLVHICEARPDLCEGFLNRLFAMLNWTLTEFTVSAQELGEGPAAQPAAGEDALKRRCIVMLELSATMARVLEFVTARLARAFLEGPPLNMARLAETACFVVAHLAAPTAAARAICAVLSSRFPAAQNAKRAVLLAPVLGMLLNVWQSEREGRGGQRRSMFAAAPEEGAAGGRKSLVAALAAVGFGGYSGCIAARAVKALAAEEFPSDAMWLDRLPQLNALASALNALVKQQQRARQAEESSDEDVPEEFIDPIMMTPMTDPVLLPDSRTAVDRSTAVRHLLTSATDPFTRAPLSLEELQDDLALRMRIDSWRAKRRRS